jgi:hypothetical protein
MYAVLLLLNRLDLCYDACRPRDITWHEDNVSYMAFAVFVVTVGKQFSDVCCYAVCRPRDITWHEDNWDNPDSRFLAWTLHDNREGGSGDIYIAFNAHGFEVRWQMHALQLCRRV